MTWEGWVERCCHAQAKHSICLHCPVWGVLLGLMRDWWHIPREVYDYDVAMQAMFLVIS